MLQDTVHTDTSLDRADAPFQHPWRQDAALKARQLEAKAQSRFAPLIRALYKVPRLRRFCLRLCHRTEGGAFYSQTLRTLLRDMHGIEVGRYTYGPVLEPGVLPRGSRIGSYCSIGPGLVVRRRDHPVDRPVLHPFFYNSALGFLEKDTIQLDEENPLIIGNDVWMGDRVTILSGCRSIGNGAVLAAGAVVTRDVEPYAIMGGVPAKLLRFRFSEEERERLEASRWWDRDIADLVGNPHLVGQNGVPEGFLK